MSIEQVPDGISTEDGATTPESVRVLVAVLFETVEQLQRRIGAVGGAAQSELKQFLAAAIIGSTWEASTAKRAGIGTQARRTARHPGQTRMLKPVEQVDRLIDLRPVL